MPIEFRLSSTAPVGITVNALTGVVTGTALEQGSGTFQRVRFDTDSNTVVPGSECDFEWVCEPGDDGLQTTIEEHLANTPHFTEAEICEIAEQKAREQAAITLASANLSNLKSCCNDPIVHLTRCGQAHVFTDWDSDGIIHIDDSDLEIVYTGSEPDEADAVFEIPFDENNIPTSRRPNNIYAGPPLVSDPTKISQVTHISICGRWVKLGDGTPIASEIICIHETVDPGRYPYQFNYSGSSWEIGGTNYPFPECPQLTVTNCATGSGTSTNTTGITGQFKPSPLALSDLDGLVGITEPRGCAGVLTSPSGVTSGIVATLDFKFLEGRGEPNVSINDVTSLKFKFRVEQGGDFGVAMVDLFGNTTVVGDESKEFLGVDQVLPPAGADFDVFADYVNIRDGIGDWEIDFKVGADLNPIIAAANSNTIEPIIFGFGVNGGPMEAEIISNYTLDIGYRVKEPCGLFENAQQEADFLTAINPDGIRFYVQEDGNVCALVTPEQAVDYSNNSPSYADIESLGTRVFQLTQATFPLTYDPVDHGWLINDSLVPFGGDGIFQTPQDLTDFMEEKDFGVIWQAEKSGNTWTIFADVADPNRYNGFFGLGEGRAVCISIPDNFPLTYGNDTATGHGWLVNNKLLPYPASSGVWSSPFALADHMTTVNPDQATFTAYLENIAGQSTYRICAQLPAGNTTSYGSLLYDGTDQFINLINNVQFPASYAAGDGWPVNGQITQYEGDGTFTLQEFLDFLNSNVDTAGDVFYSVENADGSFNINGTVNDNTAYGTPQLTGSFIYHCEFENITFPLLYDFNTSGWDNYGSVKPLGGVGSLLTPGELETYMNSNDDGNNTWSAVQNPDNPDTWNFCASILEAELPNYKGFNNLTNFCFIPLQFPFFADQQEHGIIVDGQKRFFTQDFYETPADFISFVESEDPYGLTWTPVYDPDTNTWLICSLMQDFQAQSFSAFVDKETAARRSYLKTGFPVNWSTNVHGWIVNGTRIVYETTTTPPASEARQWGDAYQWASFMNGADSLHTWQVDELGAGLFDLFAYMRQAELATFGNLEP